MWALHCQLEWGGYSVPEGWVCDCVCLLRTSSCTRWWVGNLGSRYEVLGPRQGCCADRGARFVEFPGICTCLWTWRMLCVYACTSELLSLLAREDEGFLAFSICLTWVLCISAAEGSLWCVISVSCLCLRVSVCLWGMCSALLLAECAKVKVAAMFPRLDRDP